MRVPKRKGEEDKRLLAEPEDQHLTRGAISRFTSELERLFKYDRAEAVSEVKRLAEMGDFSENAGYQIAKATLRRINDRITTLEEKLKHAVPIQSGTDASGGIRIGSRGLLEAGGREVWFEIVGSQETSPSKGRISHKSPLGSVLLHHKVGETVSVPVKDGEVAYRIVRVE